MFIHDQLGSYILLPTYSSVVFSNLLIKKQERIKKYNIFEVSEQCIFLFTSLMFIWKYLPISNYLLKVCNIITRQRVEVFSNFTMETFNNVISYPLYGHKRIQDVTWTSQLHSIWALCPLDSVFIVNFEEISYFVLVFMLLTFNR